MNMIPPHMKIWFIFCLGGTQKEKQIILNVYFIQSKALMKWKKMWHI